MRVYGYQFAVGETRLINARGQYVRGISGASRYQVQLEEGPATGFETGIAYAPPKPFEFIRVTNTADVPQFIEIAIADGTVADNRLVGEVGIKPLSGIQAVGDVAGGGTIAANRDRHQLVMRAAPGNAGNITVAGIPLQPGDTFDLNVTGAVAVGGAAADKLHVAEII